MTVIENINIAYVSQDLTLLSSADADVTKDLRYISVFAIGDTFRDDFPRPVFD